MAKKPDTILVNGTEVPITYTKSGKIDKKSIDAINAVKMGAIAEKITPTTKVDVIDVCGVVGLTVAYRTGFDVMGDYIGKFAAVVGEVTDAFEELIKKTEDFFKPSTKEEPSEAKLMAYKLLIEEYEREKAKHEERLAKLKETEQIGYEKAQRLGVEIPEEQLKKMRDQQELTQKQIDYWQKRIDDLKALNPSPEDEKRANKEEELIKWLIAMGLGVFTLNFSKTHTITDFIPG